IDAPHAHAFRDLHRSPRADGDADRPRLLVWQHRLIGESSRPHSQHRDPLTLAAGEWTRVVDVDPAVHAAQLPPAQHPIDVVLTHTELGKLSPRDNAILRTPQLANRCRIDLEASHAARSHRVRPRSTVRQGVLWIP